MRKTIFILTAAFIMTVLPLFASAANVHSGRIYLQVEKKGEAWYINPTDNKRYYLGRPLDAFNVMRAFGLGISEKNIAQIPIGLLKYSGADSDADGLPDDMETAIGTKSNNADSDGDDFSDAAEIGNWYNPNGGNKLPINSALTNKLKGKILLQVEKKGEAWYLNPTDSKRYFLGRPQNAFEIMYNLGIGITNKNLEKINSSYIKESYEAAGTYKIKYPSGWAKQINPKDEKLISDKNLGIINSLILTPSNNSGWLKIYVFESAKDFTLSDFAISKISSAEKVLDQNLQIGVKPARKQKFKYNTDFTSSGVDYKKGAEYYLDIMITTKKFIQLRMIVFNENDIEMFEDYLNQIINDFTPIY